MKNTVNIGLLSHMLVEGNLGCVALSMSNIALIDRAVREVGIEPRYSLLVTDKIRQSPLDIVDASYEYRVFPSSKQTLKNPMRYFRSPVFDGIDVVFNICAGDGYTDIYGYPRLISESYMSLLCQRRGVPIVFSPQTIGPFESKKARALARRTLSGLSGLFVRDAMSRDCCEALGLTVPLHEVIDVAFALPYERAARSEEGPVRFGLNISGLLYNGGYDGGNYFGLSINYKDYIDELVAEVLSLDGVELHLIPHVIHNDPIENDYAVSERVAARDPRIVLAPRFPSPVEAKSYISGMDFFTGARMHSTIAAISSGVPVAPVAYSRKVNGLYGTLRYPYFVDAKAAHSEHEAVDETLSYFDRRVELAEVERATCKPIWEKRLDAYSGFVSQIVTGL